MKPNHKPPEPPPTIANYRVPVPPLALDPDAVIAALESEIGRAVGAYHRERAKVKTLEEQLDAAYQRIAALTAKETAKPA